MNINELENLRLGILKEVDKAKPLAMLSTFFIPISSFLAFYYSGYDLDISMIYIIAICLMPIFLSIYEIFEMEKIPQIKYDVFARFAIMLPVFFLINFVEKYKTLGLIGTLFLISFSMFFAYKLIVKEIKIKKAKKYKIEFKNQALTPYISSLGYKYSPNGRLESMYIKHSKLFREDINFDYDYTKNGDDKIWGNFDGVKFTFTDILLVDNIKNYAIYGIFFHATFNKNIKSTTFVVSKDAVCDNTKKLKQITMDDTKFNATFNVYCDDVQNAMYILSPAFMKRLLDLKRRLNFPISVSFVGDKIYIFLDTGKDNFEPDIDKSVLHANPAFTIKRELSHFLSIVKTLNLNTRIWKI